MGLVAGSQACEHGFDGQKPTKCRPVAIRSTRGHPNRLQHGLAPVQARPRHCCTCQVPGRHVLHLPPSHTPMEAPPEFLRPQRSVAVPVRPRARARMRQAQNSAHPWYHHGCHPCTLRGLAQSISGVRPIFLDEENRHEPLSKRSAGAQTPEQHISSSRKQLPKPCCYHAFSGCALSRRYLQNENRLSHLVFAA